MVPDPTGGAYSAPPGPLAGLRGPTSKRRGGEGSEGEESGEGGEGSEGEESRGGGEGREETLDPHNVGDRLTPLTAKLIKDDVIHEYIT